MIRLNTTMKIDFGTLWEQWSGRTGSNGYWERCGNNHNLRIWIALGLTGQREMRSKKAVHWPLKKSARYESSLLILEAVDSMMCFSIVEMMILLSDVLVVSIDKEAYLPRHELTQTARCQASRAFTLAGRLQKDSMAWKTFQSGFWRKGVLQIQVYAAVEIGISLDGTSRTLQRKDCRHCGNALWRNERDSEDWGWDFGTWIQVSSILWFWCWILHLTLWQWIEVTLMNRIGTQY